LRKGGNLKHSAWASNNQYEKFVWKENRSRDTLEVNY